MFKTFLFNSPFFFQLSIFGVPYSCKSLLIKNKMLNNSKCQLWILFIVKITQAELWTRSNIRNINHNLNCLFERMCSYMDIKCPCPCMHTSVSLSFCLTEDVLWKSINNKDWMQKVRKIDVNDDDRDTTNQSEVKRKMSSEGALSFWILFVRS